MKMKKGLRGLQKRLDQKYAKRLDTKKREKRFYKEETRMLNSIRRERMRTMTAHRG